MAVKWLHQKIQDELHQKLRVAAAERQVSKQELVSRILTLYFEVRENSVPPTQVTQET